MKNHFCALKMCAVAMIASAAPAVTTPAMAQPGLFTKRGLARTEDGASLMKKAADLEAEGKLEAAGDMYDRAATAFGAAGQSDQQIAALKKSADVLERYADQLTKGTPPKQGGATPKVKAPAAPARDSHTALPIKPLRLPQLAPRPGYVIGRAVFEDGRPIPQFTAWVAGYDGQVNLFAGTVPSLGTVEASNGRYAIQTKDTFKHVRPVTGTVIGVHAVAKIPYRNQNYLLEMYPLDGKTNGPDKGDFRGNSGPGVVRDFVLKMRGLRPGYSANEETETRYSHAFYGGAVTLDGQVSSKPDVIFEDATALSQAFKEGSVEVTLTPDGPLLDGTTGLTITSSTPVGALRLGGNWRLRVIRNIPLGVYTATARLVLPSGEAHALRVRGDIRSTSHWQPSLSVTWTPWRNSGLADMLTSPTLYVGQ